MASSITSKYRPKSFSEVVGQDAVVRSLEEALKARSGTAYLLSGPSGCGKTTLARIAASYLGCAPEDLQEIDAATKTGIEDMRDVTAGLMYRPLGDGDVRVVIVDECHGLSKAAVTSLLKALEDPPPWVYWFLCTTDPQKVPAAVKTRCLSYQLKEVGVGTLAKMLSKTDEGRQAGPDIVDLCAKEAGGSPRQALANLGVCVGAGSLADARELMRTAAEVPAAIDLARILLNGGKWRDVCPVIEALGETSAESVRHVVRAYMTKVALNPKSRDTVEQALAVLEAFSQPFPSGDGVSPLVLACGRLILSGRAGG